MKLLQMQMEGNMAEQYYALPINYNTMEYFTLGPMTRADYIH
ncbi:hypothetical protein SAMN05216232_3018 [Virgibacillus subterraneus]|uniref:Uncharacterized protein n=1 Tax=Virgibacillus subterraneus TaxID=621109 RepID=A0A1H9HSX1_9BACI|nr:hypothetical protein SAMN05216232_3018 [Virgibacillus subterraneus]